MTPGLPNHSRKLHAYDVLGLVGETKPSWQLVIDVMLAYPVVERTVTMMIEALLWDGYLARARVRDGDRRTFLTSITEKGRRALADPVLAGELETLPQRHRAAKAWLTDPSNPEPMRATVKRWRVEMRS